MGVASEHEVFGKHSANREPSKFTKLILANLMYFCSPSLYLDS